MRPTFLARLVFVNTFKKKLRAFLVIAGIAISSSVMIVLFGISAGLHDLVTNELNKSAEKNVVTVTQRNLAQIKMDQERISKLRSISGVNQVETSVGLVGTLDKDDNNLSLPTYGLTKDYFELNPTRFINGEGKDLTGQNIVVSRKVVDVLKVPPNRAIGSSVTARIEISKDYASQQSDLKVTTKPQVFTIVGVVEKGDAPLAYFPLDTLRAVGIDSVSELKVRVSSSDRIKAVRESIEQMGFQTQSVQDTIDRVNRVFSVIHRTLAIFGVIVLAITISGTFTIISLTLMEEMKQVGFLRISGMRNREVMMLFIAQSILLTTLGAFLGAIGGIFAGGFVNSLADSAAQGEMFSDSKVILFNIPTIQITLVLLLAVVVGLLVGMFPAKRAVMIRPLDELKL